MMEDQNEVAALKAEIYDISKEVRGLSQFISEIGKFLEVEEPSLESIMEAVKATKED